MTLTPEQMEEAVEAAMEAGYHAVPYEYMQAALTAALPVIERAVLKRASEVARHYDDDLNHCTGMFDSLADQILALAEEAR